MRPAPITLIPSVQTSTAFTEELTEKNPLPYSLSDMGMRIAVILLSSIGIAASAVLALTDYWIQSGTETGLRRAIQWAPWNPLPHVMMAQLNASNAATHLRRAVELSPLDARIKILLALELEMQGFTDEAERLLLEAARADKTFQSEWSLANFYLRRGRLEQFWTHARRAAAVSHADLTGLLALCLRIRPEPDSVMEILRLERPAALTRLLEAATAFDLAAKSLAVGEKVAREPGAAARDALGKALSQSVDKGNMNIAIRYWNVMARHGHLDAGEIRGTGIVNGAFAGELAGLGFDWLAPAVDGVRVYPGGGVRVEMSGRQPAEFTILRQRAPVDSGRRYTLKYRYRLETNPASSPARWWVDGIEGPAMSGAGWQEGELEFVARRELATVELRVRRESGTIRPEGTLEIAWVRTQTFP
jgi:hypothetical protein